MLSELLKCLRRTHPDKSTVIFSPHALIAVILFLIPKSSRKLHATKEGLCACVCVCIEEGQGRMRFGVVICPARQQEQEVGRSDREVGVAL